MDKGLRPWDGHLPAEGYLWLSGLYGPGPPASCVALTSLPTSSGPGALLGKRGNSVSPVEGDSRPRASGFWAQQTWGWREYLLTTVHLSSPFEAHCLHQTLEDFVRNHCFVSELCAHSTPSLGCVPTFPSADNQWAGLGPRLSFRPFLSHRFMNKVKLPILKIAPNIPLNYYWSLSIK